MTFGRHACLMATVCVHVGGHVTLLFSIHSETLLTRRQGSRGAGLCLENGIIAEVSEIEDAEDQITVVRHNGEELEGGDVLYTDLLKEFRDIFKVNSPVSISLELELPVSQGFGMSAAGLLATSLALGELFDVGNVGQLARLAHRIERTHSAGLGDILGLWAGGVELRTTPGAPPSPGKVRCFTADVPALLVWVPEGMKHTSGYIDDPKWKKSITKAGNDCVNRLMKLSWDRNVWQQLLSESDRFAMDSGLLEESERSNLLATVIDNLEPNMSSHLCMLGTSVVVVPRKLSIGVDFEDLAAKLRSLGLGVFLTHIQ